MRCSWRWRWGVAACVLLVGCGGVAPRRTHYAQTVDSATSACLRNPACYAAVGDDAVLPWLARAGSAGRTTSAVLRLLSAAELTQVETVLVECAKEAHFQINEREFGPGKSPTREQCDEVVGNKGTRTLPAQCVWVRSSTRRLSTAPGRSWRR